MGKRKCCNKIIEAKGNCQKTDNVCPDCPFYGKCDPDHPDTVFRYGLACAYLKDHPKKSKTPGLDAWKPKPGEEIKFGTDRNTLQHGNFLGYVENGVQKYFKLVEIDENGKELYK